MFLGGLSEEVFIDLNQNLAFLEFSGWRGEKELALVLRRLGLVDVQSVVHANGYYKLLISK